MFGVGFFEMIIIAVVALVVVGPKRLPEVMRQAGRLFVHVRRTANDVRATFDQVIREAENEIRMEEAQSLRQALQPVLDAKKDMAAAISAQEQAIVASVKPAGTATYTPGTSLGAAAPAADTGAAAHSAAAPMPGAAAEASVQPAAPVTPASTQLTSSSPETAPSTSNKV